MASAKRDTRVAIIGLGATGRAVASTISGKNGLRVVAGVDNDPRLKGTPLGEVVGRDEVEGRVYSSIEAMPSADVAFVATTSYIKEVEDTLNRLIDRGIHVVTITEEMGYPWLQNGLIAKRIDARALANGVTVLGTGCNPGLLLDTLPSLLSALVVNPVHIRQTRTADMSGYGGILKKFGIGLNSSAFYASRDRGEVVGHVGFAESLHALAAAVGWAGCKVEIDSPEIISVAESPRVGACRTVQSGEVLSVAHRARAHFDDRVVIDVDARFGFFSPEDNYRPGVDWRIETSDSELVASVSEGLDSFSATVAVVCNVLPELVDAMAGLLTTSDLPPRLMAGKALVS